MIFSLIAIGAVVGIIIVFVIYRAWPKISKQTLNKAGTGVSEHRDLIFDRTIVPTVKRSTYFPDDLYIGRMAKLDSTLKVMFKNILFGFPIEPLIVSKFLYFDIDGNPFEEVRFDKIGAKDYTLLYDTTEKTIYFLNKLMTIGVPEGETPVMVTDDVITLEEAEEKYTYEDFSGLIKVNVTSEGDNAFDRLIRVYQRAITPDDNEYCIMMLDKPGVMSIYIGFNIGIVQLEAI